MRTNPNKRLYKGRSMKGTFKFGDRLISESIPMQNIKPGDVIIYRRRNHEKNYEELVHRVISSLPEGMIVQGDNNPYIDKTPVTDRHLLGKVVYVERNGKRFPVQSGLIGLVRARISHGLGRVRRRMWTLILRMGRSLYGRLRRSGLPGRLWRPPIDKILLRTKDGPLVKYLHQNRTVALYFPSNGRFLCRKPYDLVLSKDKLTLL
ncbi:MAG: hypothetical protein JRJ51_09080 [Deltaproteobacteria bacterium]|nr:hypothetical protein [Deltaproteobacteria bacterium]